MAERVSWAVGSDTERILTSEDARIAWAGLLTPTSATTARSGFRPTGAATDPGRVFATTPTPDGVVHVEPFTYHLQSTRGGGVYTMTLDAIKDINILGTAPADSTNDRADLIIAQQSDLFHGDPDSRMRIRHIVGTPANPPQDPPITGSPDHVRLARITVHANTAAITPTDIQGLRPADRATVALGGLLPIPDQAARTTITNPYHGMAVYRRDRDCIEIHDGTTWQRYPRGLIGRARRTTTSNTTSNPNTLIAVLRLDNVAVRAGRITVIKTGRLQPGVTNNNCQPQVEIRYSTTGTATTTSPLLPGSRLLEVFLGTTGIETTYLPTTDQTLSLLLCVSKVGGDGLIGLLADAGCWIELFVYDEGIDIGDTGTISALSADISDTGTISALGTDIGDPAPPAPSSKPPNIP